MQVLYLHMPELPRTRHIIVGEKHIINTAAPESNIFHRVVRHKEAMQIKQIMKNATHGE